MLIDSHVNLHAPQFADDRAEVIARARAAGVGLMITICDKLASFEAVAALAQTHDDIWCTVGVHPHEAKDYADLAPERLIALSQHSRVVGIGECGLDYRYDLSPRDIQRQVFAAHIAAAQATGLPLVVHTREADDDMGDMLERAHAERPFKLLMHCYTSGAELAARAAALGAWFSVSGIATFKAADDVRAVIAEMPGDRILLETDCPYLAPVPFRGRRNEPAYLPHIAAKLAQIRGWSLDETEARTTAAVFDLFHRIDRPSREFG
jgi:TatD DNase family protein